MQVFVPQGVTVEDLLPDLVAYAEDRLPAPVPVFLPWDEELGWTYVQVPIDFRTTPETWEPVVLTAYVPGPPGTVPWVTLTVEPDRLLFASGDPTDPGLVASCVGPAAVAPYDPEVPGACSYTYRNASTTVPSGVFTAELGISWTATYESSNGPGTLDLAPTITPTPIQIAEIKALVICTGPDPLQGNC